MTEQIPSECTPTVSSESTIDHGSSGGTFTPADPILQKEVESLTVIVGSLAGGMSFEEVQREYALTAEDIRAALKFVSELAQQGSFHPLPTV